MYWLTKSLIFLPKWQEKQQGLLVGLHDGARMIRPMTPTMSRSWYSHVVFRHCGVDDPAEKLEGYERFGQDHCERRPPQHGRRYRAASGHASAGRQIGFPHLY